MNWKTAILVVILLDFAALTGWAIYEVGYIGLFAAGLAGPGALQVLTDLVIMGGLLCIWMVGDARARDINPWPFIVITVFAGSFGPLLYLLVRSRQTATQPHQTVAS